jgi:rSAM-associated Gly-rich repeat protein
MNNPEKTKVTDRLKALLLGAAAVTAVQSSSAAQVQPTAQNGPGSLETRVEKVRQQLNTQANGEIRTGNGHPGDADLFWWRNAWGNGGVGGWHNWGNGGWHNWHNGWGNWHNF